MVQLRRCLYVGDFLFNSSQREIEVLEDAAIGVDEQGIITFIQKNLSEGQHSPKSLISDHGWDDCDVVYSKRDGEVRFFFPGFIDTHTHACQYPNTGIFGKSTLMSWLKTYTFPLESSFASNDRARAIYERVVTATLRSGTTTATYFASLHTEATTILAEICLRRGQRAFVGRCAMDCEQVMPDYYTDGDPETSVRESEKSAEAIFALYDDDNAGSKSKIPRENMLVQPIVTPRFAPSCTPAALEGLGKLAQKLNLPIQTHISENELELELVKKLFPQHASYTAVYDAFGLLTARTVLAHAIHLTPEERALAAARGTGVSHCPPSNTYLSSGICPVRELLDAGVSVSLGTDMSGGYSPSILVAAREAGGVSRLRAVLEDVSDAEMAGGVGTDGEKKDETPAERKERLRNRRKLDVEETLWMATRGGARCLGLGEKVGGFEVGMSWDAQLVDLGRIVKYEEVDLLSESGKGNVEVWEGMKWEDRLAKWVICGDDRNTAAVWVAGRLVVGGR